MASALDVARRGEGPRSSAPWRRRGGSTHALAAFLMLVPFLAALLSSAGFAAGIAIGAFHLPAAIAGAALATWAVTIAERLGARACVRAVAIGLATIAAAILAAHAVWDLSYDGQAYHQTAVRHLAAGWNPVARSLTPAETTHGLWVNHYVRAAELGTATVVAWTGSLESGKAFGLALLVPAVLLGALALRGAGVRRAVAVPVAILAASSPVVVSQLPTYYVDGELALVFVISLALAWMALRSVARSAPFLLGVSLALLANVKFTGTVYAGLVLAGYGVAVLWRSARGRRRARLLAPGALGALGALAIGWQPLVTNAVEHGHPFYPVAGAERVDGRSGQTPYFRHADPARQLLQSIFSETASGRVVPQPKLPFVVHQRELEAMQVPDVRVAGFGPLFGLAVLFVVAGVAALRWSSPGAGSRAGLLVAAGVLITVLVNPGAWWARFAPQLWIAVALACVALVAARGGARVAGLAALAVLCGDATLVATSVARYQAKTQAAASSQLRELARGGLGIDVPRGEMESIDARAALAGLQVRYVDRCAPSLPLVGTYATFCSPPAGSPGGGTPE